MFTVIVSASRATNSQVQNMVLTTELASVLRAKLGQIPMPCVGYYKEDDQAEPVYEASLMVVGLSTEQAQWVMNVACINYLQDCVLVVREGTEQASLWSRYSMDYIGKFTEVTHLEESIAFTQIGFKFYVCK